MTTLHFFTANSQVGAVAVERQGDTMKLCCNNCKNGYIVGKQSTACVA